MRRYLTEQVFNGPVIVIDWPKGIKAFYMRLNEDEKTVAAMDVLVPKVGSPPVLPLPVAAGSLRKRGCRSVRSLAEARGRSVSRVWRRGDPQPSGGATTPAGLTRGGQGR